MAGAQVTHSRTQPDVLGKLFQAIPAKAVAVWIVVLFDVLQPLIDNLAEGRIRVRFLAIVVFPKKEVELLLGLGLVLAEPVERFIDGCGVLALALLPVQLRLYLFSGSGVEKTSVFSLTRAISGPDDNKGIISRSSTIG